MEFRGTKRKWNVEKCQNRLYCDYLIIDENGYQLALVDNEYVQDYEKTKANALLISKAPEMLELLEDIYFGSDGNDINYWKDKIEQLIKEATEL